AIDKAGNVEEKTVFFVIDKTEPNINIDEPKFDITNKKKIYLNGSLDEYANLTIDDENVEVIDLKFSYLIELDEGENLIKIKAFDYAGNAIEKEMKIFLDTIPPYLEIIEPKYNKTMNEKINIKGKTEPKAKVYINEIEVFVNEKGEFNYTLKLKIGENKIEIRSLDSLGNEKKESLVIWRSAKVEGFGIPLNLLLPIIGIIIVLCLGLVIGMHIYRKRKKEYVPYYPYYYPQYPQYPQYQPPQPPQEQVPIAETPPQPLPPPPEEQKLVCYNCGNSTEYAWEFCPYCNARLK
ncbi:MAG: hypothetical protein AB1779_11710, partial [Candidatus Thermoplasmatota archaeon]